MNNKLENILKYYRKLCDKSDIRIYIGYYPDFNYDYSVGIIAADGKGSELVLAFSTSKSIEEAINNLERTYLPQNYEKMI